jgi:hypothetical protein
MLRIPHCLDSPLTDGGKVVSPTSAALYSPETLSFLLLVLVGAGGGGVMLKKLCYNPEGRGFDTGRGEFA